MNLTIAKLSAVQEAPVREADVFDKLHYTASELMCLSETFSRHAKKFEVARSTQDFAAIRSTYITLQEVRDQTSFLLEGVQHAIEKETERRKS